MLKVTLAALSVNIVLFFIFNVDIVDHEMRSHPNLRRALCIAGALSQYNITHQQVEGGSRFLLLDVADKYKLINHVVLASLIAVLSSLLLAFIRQARKVGAATIEQGDEAEMETSPNLMASISKSRQGNKKMASARLNGAKIDESLAASAKRASNSSVIGSLGEAGNLEELQQPFLANE